MLTFSALLEAVILVTALSLDAFIACFGYGMNKIKIPFLSAQVINIVCTAILALSLYVGVALRTVIPETVTQWFCVILLFALGAAKLFEELLKRRIRSRSFKKEFRMFSLNFILHVYANPEEADVDTSRVLSPKEATLLAIALSIDGLTVGVGAGLAALHPLSIVVCSLLLGYLAILLGCALGRKVTDRVSIDLSWLGGALLMVLAIFKLLPG